MASEIIDKQKTLGYSFWDGVFASLMGGLVQNYFIPFLLALGATVGQVGVLGAAPNLFASIIQLESPGLVEKFRARKPIINLFVPLQALSLLCMALLAVLAPPGPSVTSSLPVDLFITAVVLFTAFGALVNPAWSSMMSEIVDKDKWGEYFGWRNQALGFTTILGALAAGVMLHFMKGMDLFAGFAVLFGAAFVSRMASWRCLRLMEEPALKQDPGAGRKTFLKGLFAGKKPDNFARFVFFTGAVHFSAGLASPFFSVLMLKDLHFSYPTYIAVASAQAVAVYLSIKRWGRHADRTGNIKIIKSTSKLIVFIPVLWLVSRSPFYLIFAQAFSGFVWAGFNLSTSNFAYDACNAGRRPRCIAWLGAVTGTGLGLGALAGGFLIPELPSLFGQKIFTLFVVSAAARFAVAFFIPFGVREVRRVEKISTAHLLSSMAGIARLQKKQEPDFI